MTTFPCLSGKKPCGKGWTMLTPDPGQVELTCHLCRTRHELVGGEWQRKREQQSVEGAGTVKPTSTKRAIKTHVLVD